MPQKSAKLAHPPGKCGLLACWPEFGASFRRLHFCFLVSSRMQEKEPPISSDIVFLFGGVETVEKLYWRDLIIPPGKSEKSPVYQWQLAFFLTSGKEAIFGLLHRVKKDHRTVRGPRGRRQFGPGEKRRWERTFPRQNAKGQTDF